MVENMNEIKEVMIDIWREACRHIEITESLPLIAELLKQHLPMEQLFIRRYDATNQLLETIAFGLNESSKSPYTIATQCNQAQVGLVSHWHQQGKVARRIDLQNAQLFSTLVPFDDERDVLATPLMNRENGFPTLVFIALPNEAFSDQHISMMRLLIEPLTIALENNDRFWEMVKLKEAAEADKKSLLTKLSRKEMGDVVIGANVGLRKVTLRVSQVAHSDVPVLLFGETGTGKELIARAIHNQSGRSDGPFIRVNCGAIPRELIDSQLFGHERGAFTGAVETHNGWFERANRGTLFLDEIGEMPPEAQVRLLRILQDGWMERVGGKQPIRVDVRIVLATHRDLASMVAGGTFREDLWYRISTFPIFLPPLRERLEDLNVLAQHFSERSAIRFGLTVRMPTDQDIEMLAMYNWPGNIRELGTVIDRAALLGNGQRLEIRAALGWTDTPQISVGKSSTTIVDAPPDQRIAPLDEVIKRHIERALVRTKGKIEGKGGAAALLKINPHTLRARMRKLGIQWKVYRVNVE
jgi:hydrogenase-4 transcriptional activator